jgi:hypothetical protein
VRAQSDRRGELVVNTEQRTGSVTDRHPVAFQVANVVEPWLRSRHRREDVDAGKGGIARAEPAAPFARRKEDGVACMCSGCVEQAQIGCGCLVSDDGEAGHRGFAEGSYWDGEGWNEGAPWCRR